MSNARNVKVAVDLKTMSEVALDNGYVVDLNCKPRGWMNRPMGNKNCDIVLKKVGVGNRHDNYDIGFVEDKVTKNVTMVADFHGGNVDSKLKELMPAYYERLIKTKGQRAGFRVTGKVEDKEKICITVRR